MVSKRYDLKPILNKFGDETHETLFKKGPESYDSVFLPDGVRKTKTTTNRLKFRLFVLPGQYHAHNVAWRPDWSAWKGRLVTKCVELV